MATRRGQESSPVAVNGTIDYELVLQDLMAKRADLDAAIETVRRISGRVTYNNPFATVPNIRAAQTTPRLQNGNGKHHELERQVTTFGFGRNKGVPTDQMAIPDLIYYRDWLRKTVASGTSRYQAADQNKLQIVELELTHRGAN